MKFTSALAAAVFKEHRALLWVIALQVSVSWLLCVAAGRPVLAGFDTAFFAVAGATVIFGVMALATRLVRSRPNGMPVMASYRLAWTTLRGEIFTRGWAASVGILVLVLPLSMSVFSAAKRTIPVIHPFAWDSTIEEVGRRLYGGRHIWELLQPLVGHPAVTRALDTFYYLGWSLVVLGALALVIVSPPSALRRKYLTAFALLLLVGTLVALTLSSAGPAFYDRVVRGLDPYAPLFSYLATVAKSTPLMSAETRDVLWSAYRNHVDAFGLGISAMPSMHVATATLVACLGFAISPLIGVVGSACALLVMVASIALGWHYSLDGFVGALLAMSAWRIAGQLEHVLSGGFDFKPTPLDSLVVSLPRRQTPVVARPRGLVAIRTKNQQRHYVSARSRSTARDELRRRVSVASHRERKSM